ncbi:hypothetical protein KP509_09G052900 [Ceratopteris richardii]|uniref:Uncharacterized protein n=1 Tax=Ceratopteris richardii TaxID=49495 RepID=A0A8T2U7Z7_CERRI|nr:hypothetical protein KP509_09G052900 [Ceratopteris richardii]
MANLTIAWAPFCSRSRSSPPHPSSSHPPT